MADSITFDYERTHVSHLDGSDAMMVSRNPFVLINEDGETWLANEVEWFDLTTDAHACEVSEHDLQDLRRELEDKIEDVERRVEEMRDRLGDERGV